jgi:hypothetical protein
MLSHRIEQSAHPAELTDSFSPFLPNPPRSHTQLQQVATGVRSAVVKGFGSRRRPGFQPEGSRSC